MDVKVRAKLFATLDLISIGVGKLESLFAELRTELRGELTDTRTGIARVDRVRTSDAFTRERLPER